MYFQRLLLLRKMFGYDSIDLIAFDFFFGILAGLANNTKTSMPGFLEAADSTAQACRGLKLIYPSLKLFVMWKKIVFPLRGFLRLVKTSSNKAPLAFLKSFR